MLLLTSSSDSGAIIEAGAPRVGCAAFSLIPFISGTMSTAIYCTWTAFECQLVEFFFWNLFLSFSFGYEFPRSHDNGILMGMVMGMCLIRRPITVCPKGLPCWMGLGEGLFTARLQFRWAHYAVL